MICLLRGRRLFSLLTIAIGLAAPKVHASVLPSGVDLWFSSSTPTVSFKSGFKYLGPGSILSTSGQVVATNKQLLASFKPRFGVPNDRGLDALAIVGSDSDRTIVFSTNRSFHSNALNRQIGDGDLITNKGEVMATNEQLLAAFDPKGSNFGLDAAFVRSLDDAAGPEIWFSTSRSFYSNAMSAWLAPGDILSNQGHVVTSASDLLAAFGPRGKTASIGIDSLSVNQGDAGEVFWFSTNKDFYSNTLKRWIRSADLLSSDGSIVMSQKELMKNFGFIVPICGKLELDAATFSVPNQPPPKPPPKTPEPTTVSLLLIASLMGLARRKH